MTGGPGPSRTELEREEAAVLTVRAARTPAGDDGAVARNFLVLGTGEALARLVAFSATIYVARSLGAASYGVIGVATAVMLYLTRVADLGMDLGIGVREVAMQPSRLATIAPAMLSLRLVVATLLVASVGVVGLTVLPQPDGIILALYGLTLLAAGINSRWIHLGLERSRRVATARIVGEITMAVLVVLALHDRGDVTQVPLAQLAGDMVAALLLLGWLQRGGLALPFRLDWSVVRPLLRGAPAMVVSSLLGLVVYNADTIFLRVLRGAASVGYYTAAYTLVSFLTNVGIAYSLSLLPALTRLADRVDEQRALYHTALAQVFAAALPAAIGGCLLAPQIVTLFFGTGFAPAISVLQLLIWTIPVSVVRDVPVIALMASGREDQVLRMTALAAACNLTLNFVLIPPYGLSGAALATLLTEVVRLVAAFVYVRSAGFPVTTPARLWRAGVAGLFMAGLLVAVGAHALSTSILLGAVMYVAVLALLGGIRLRRGRLPVLDV